MLSFTQVHHITDRLLAARTPNQLLTIHTGTRPGRRLRTISTDLHDHRAGSPDAATSPGAPTRRRLASARVRALIAVAVVYDEDLGGVLCRTDAVDTDGRLYRITHYPDQQSTVEVEDTPHPHQLPACWPQLTGILASATAVTA
jgi:hypothetical protein